MENKINNQSGFTLIELFIIIPLPIVITWEIGLIILKNYSLNNWLIYLSIPLGVVLGIILFFIFVQTYAHHKNQHRFLSAFLTLVYWLSILAILYILPEYFLKDAKYFIINAIIALPIILILSASVFFLKRNK